MVEMHTGRLWLESSGIPGEGSTFSFTLPLYIPDEPGLPD
jgi:signal transduction histidine kinase